MAFVAESRTEGELLDVVEKLFLEISSRHVVRSVEEGKHILEHTASGTRGRHKLHDFVSLRLIVVPSLLIVRHFIVCRSHDALANGSSTFQFQEREALLDLFQLMFNLLLADTTSLNLVKILLIHNTTFMLFYANMPQK